MFESSNRSIEIKGVKMEQSEIKVTVEYIIKAPADIMVSQVDEYVQDALDDGADSKVIKARIVTDLAFAERPGIVERMSESLAVLNRIEMLTDPENQDPSTPFKVEDIHPFVSTFLDKVEEEEEEG